MQPKANQITMIFFGLTNVGKSFLMNNLFEQEISIISNMPGTTTDPVSKSIELSDLGAVNVIDTAGLDDTTEIGNLRERKTLEKLAVSNIKIFVTRGDKPFNNTELNFLKELKDNNSNYAVALTFSDNQIDSSKEKFLNENNHPFVLINNLNRDGIKDLKKIIIKFSSQIEFEISPLDGLVKENDLLLLVAPIDLAAPKDRLIQPQVATLRDALDKDCASLLVKERELNYFYNSLKIKPKLVITDSQVFNKVSSDIPEDQMLTSFSIIFARKKGDLPYYVESISKMLSIKPGSKILILESCSHHRQADDIGTVKIPRLFKQIIQPKCEFIFGRDIPNDNELKQVSLVISCASCMVSRNHVLNRLKVLKENNIPAVNYGLFLAYVNGLLPRALEPFENEYNLYKNLMK